MSMKVDIKIEQNNIPKVKKEWENKKKKILFQMGLKWQELATKVITSRVYTGNKPWKLTGRLRASLSFATPEKQGPRNSVGKSSGNDYVNGKSEKDTLTVGTNVIYARKINDKQKYMQDSIIPYADSYKNVAENIMKE